ncbi:MAG: hypothetical protein KA004_09255 [Verrucomicrobiales bacterium]|nr:hypothetical protein [Verrucomicrobiales bacterium]
MNLPKLPRPIGPLLAMGGFFAACLSVGLPWGKGELLPMINAPLLDDQTLANYNLQMPVFIRWISVAGMVSALLALGLHWARLPLLLAGLMAGLAAGPFIELWNDLKDLDQSQKERNESRGMAYESLWKKVTIKSGSWCLLGGAAAALAGAWAAGNRSKDRTP